MSKENGDSMIKSRGTLQNPFAARFTSEILQWRRELDDEATMQHHGTANLYRHGMHKSQESNTTRSLSGTLGIYYFFCLWGFRGYQCEKCTEMLYACLGRCL